MSLALPRAVEDTIDTQDEGSQASQSLLPVREDDTDSEDLDLNAADG
jgi:hypothetical protein